MKKQRQAKDFADVDKARQALAEYNELKAQPGVETQARKNQLKAHIRELHQGVLGGRKFHYQIKLAIQKGIDIWNEPMMKSVIYANQLSTYQSIKKKARILMQESCTLIGVVDETGLLEPDEIFV